MSQNDATFKPMALIIQVYDLKGEFRVLAH